jgi:hypothetical protein
MHAVAGMDAAKLILVDYGFHIPYIISAAIVAFFFTRTVQALIGRTSAPAAGRAGERRPARAA